MRQIVGEACFHSDEQVEASGWRNSSLATVVSGYAYTGVRMLPSNKK